MTAIHKHDQGPDLDAVLSTVTPATHAGRDAVNFRAIVQARLALDQAEEDLRAAVRQARAEGDSWTVVAAALGISRQAAQQRFARYV